MFTLNQIGGIVSERAYNVTEQIQVIKYDKAPHIVSTYLQSHKTNLCQIIHFLPLTNNQTNLKELDNQGLEVEVPTKDIKKEDRVLMKSPTTEAQFAKGFCKFKYVFLVLTFFMVYQWPRSGSTCGKLLCLRN